MSFSIDSARADKVWFESNNMWVSLVDGRLLAIPLSFFPVFKDVPQEQLADYELSGNGIGIHWDSLDEDLYVPNLLIADYGKTDKSA